MKPEEPKSEIILYQTEDNRTRIEVRLENETVWLTQKQMAELFQKDVRTINGHIQNLFEEGELVPESVIRKYRITAADDKSYETQHYNLDVVISVGYRVKSHRGTQFRIWAMNPVVKGSVNEIVIFSLCPVVPSATGNGKRDDLHDMFIP